MQRRLWATAVLMLSALAAGGCASMKPPTLAVDGLKVGDMGLSGVALDVGFRIRNPNPEPLRIERFEYERGSQAFRALVAASKYKVWPAFGERPSGPILLQDHGNHVSFRNLRIRELKP